MIKKLFWFFLGASIFAISECIFANYIGLQIHQYSIAFSQAIAFPIVTILILLIEKPFSKVNTQ